MEKMKIWIWTWFAQIDEEEAGGSGSKKERYFWQYNVQAKGPKGQVIIQIHPKMVQEHDWFTANYGDTLLDKFVLQKLSLDTTIHDPHKLNEIIDPVFSDNVSVHGIKHRLVSIVIIHLWLHLAPLQSVDIGMFSFDCRQMWDKCQVCSCI